MRLDRAGLPFIFGALIPAVALTLSRHTKLALSAGALAGFFAFFFRDPDREPDWGVVHDPRVVLAPADGRIMHAGVADPGVAPKGDWLQVSIFLSPLDVHVNRTPVGGRILEVVYRPGRFLPAYQVESGAENERSEIYIDQGGRTVVCRQVVGLLARRVVCRVVPGMHVQAGQRLGIMKFGSRMDVFLPTDSEVLVAAGDVVRGGESILGTLSEPAKEAPETL